MSMGPPLFLLAGVGGGSHVRSLLVYIAYVLGTTGGITAGTIAGHLAVVKFFHR